MGSKLGTKCTVLKCVWFCWNWNWNIDHICAYYFLRKFLIQFIWLKIVEIRKLNVQHCNFGYVILFSSVSGGVCASKVKLVSRSEMNSKCKWNMHFNRQFCAMKMISRHIRVQVVAAAAVHRADQRQNSVHWIGHLLMAIRWQIH